ncbi:HalOD1 output domain-containing protein [Haloplanus salilacus]|uniref:HalOD1 output domain-containing protein n=1 Tax=Haloplanus salilacus TaxID=2949994 RepID=UPI0030CE4EDB
MPDSSPTDGGRTAQYDPDRGVYVADHRETGDRELSVTVVHAVLDATGKEPTEVNLNDAIRPDALNRIFGPKHDGTLRDDGTVAFEFAGCHVAVDADGEVRVDPDP